MAMILSRRPEKAGSARNTASCVLRIRRSNSFAARSSSSSARQPRDLLDQFVAHVRPELRPDLGLSVFFDIPALGADNEIIQAHRLDFLAQPVGDIGAQLPMLTLNLDNGASLAGVRDRRRALVIIAAV